MERFQKAELILRPYEEHERKREKRPVRDTIMERCPGVIGGSCLRRDNVGPHKSGAGGSDIVDATTEGKTFAVVH
jgi:hypothetical protein